MRKSDAPAMFSTGAARHRKNVVPDKFKDNFRKHKKMILIAVAAIVLLTLILVIFTGGNGNPLLGKWVREESNGTTTLEFLPEGKLSIYMQTKNVEAITIATATYTIDENKITITMTNQKPETNQFKINDNKLTITQTGTKKTQVYVRQ